MTEIKLVHCGDEVEVTNLNKETEELDSTFVGMTAEQFAFSIMTPLIRHSPQANLDIRY